MHRRIFTVHRRRTLCLIALVAIYVVIAHLLPRPATVAPAGWRITAIFLATIAGLMLQPLPGAALVLIALMALVLIGGLTMAEALTGFATPSVWLVLAAMITARVLRDTGLARRIALLFVRRFGGSSLGVAYSLVMTDLTLASGIPSMTARGASIILPITRNIAELYDSRPGLTSKRLGEFLMVAIYQGSVVACAMFLTGQASNVLAVGLAAKFAQVDISWTSWLLAGIVPGLVSAAIVPYGVYRMLTPNIRQTPGAAAYARQQLTAMGPISRSERLVLGVMCGVVLLWMSSQWSGLDVTVVAFAGLAVLLVTDVLQWDQALAERNAWDVFVWYGGLLTLGDALNRSGSTTAFATWVGAWFTGWPWMAVLLATVVVYFYAHYAFASITAHMVAMFPPFAVMLTGLGTPPGLAVYALACMANLTAGLTHYGTTTAPIVFAEGYVSQRDWWRVGFVMSVINILTWTTSASRGGSSLGCGDPHHSMATERTNTTDAPARRPGHVLGSADDRHESTASQRAISAAISRSSAVRVLAVPYFFPDLLTGRAALVTGGGTGICRGIALALASAGCDVAIASRSLEHLEPTAAEIERLGVRSVAVPGDVRRPDDVDAVVRSTAGALGRLDILVNGAAGNFVCPADQLSPNGFGTVIDIDVKGTFNVSRAAYPLLKERGGVILNISATLQLLGTIGQAHASAAKAGVDALTRTLAAEWGPSGIRVNGLAPGPVDGTEGVRRLTTEASRKLIEKDCPLGRLATIDEVANAALFLCSDASAFITGVTLVVDGGLWLRSARAIGTA
ncbi:MAG: DASS family sodium-coupled anion symporter [Luteitalea sp.]|nr:DASS family sodium-coupled anion symporter [Luteitalea sp.]